MRRLLVLAATTSVALATVPAAASAAGARSIAEAAAVGYGQQQFGSTAENTGTFCGGSYKTSWWLLPTVVGDEVTIDWEGVGVQTLEVFPTGTNDFNFNTQNRIADQDRDTPTEGAELKFVAPTSGALPLMFATSDCNFSRTAEDGPYAFTAYVKHAVTLAVPRRSSLARTGTIDVSARTPAGAPITDQGVVVSLRVRRGSSTRVIGKAAVTNGVAKVAYNVPASFRRRKVSLSAQATGSSYLTKTTASRSVRTK